MAGVIDPHSPSHGGNADDPKWNGVDVALDFSMPDVVVGNAVTLAKRGINLVIGTTGWQKHEAAVREAVAAGGVGAVAAPNFSTGVVLFEALVARAAALFAPQQDFGAYLHEAHHAAKKDAPSGTAHLLRRSMEQAGYTRPIDVSSIARRFHSGNAHGRFRRPRRDDYPDAHRARPYRVCPGRPRGGELGARQERLVHNERRSGHWLGVSP